MSDEPTLSPDAQDAFRAAVKEIDGINLRRMANLAEVVTLYESNAQDPEAMARKLADNIRDGDFGEIRSIGVVIERTDGKVIVFGWKDCGLLRTLGLFQLAIHWLCTMRIFPKVMEDDPQPPRT